MSDLNAYRLELWTRRRLQEHYGKKLYIQISDKVFFPDDSSRYPSFSFDPNLSELVNIQELRETVETFYEDVRAELLCKAEA